MASDLPAGTKAEIGRVGGRIFDAIANEPVHLALTALLDVFLFVLLKKLPAEERAAVLERGQAAFREARAELASAERTN